RQRGYLRGLRGVRLPRLGDALLAHPHRLTTSMPQAPPTEQPVVSLVICTRDRAAQLSACLAAVAGMSCRRPWEIVVVDNGSRDDTRAVAQAFLRDHAVARYVWEPQAGLSRARNAGIGA